MSGTRPSCCGRKGATSSTMGTSWGARRLIYGDAAVIDLLRVVVVSLSSLGSPAATLTP